MKGEHHYGNDPDAKDPCRPCATGLDFHLESYAEHSLDQGSTSRAASYVGLTWGDGTASWGAGSHTDIIVAGIRALVSAINSK